MSYRPCPLESISSAASSVAAPWLSAKSHATTSNGPARYDAPTRYRLPKPDEQYESDGQLFYFPYTNHPWAIHTSSPALQRGHVQGCFIRPSCASSSATLMGAKSEYSRFHKPISTGGTTTQSVWHATQRWLAYVKAYSCCTCCKYSLASAILQH